MGAVMTLMDETVWRGKIPPAKGFETHVATREIYEAATLPSAFTDSRRVTVRGDIAPYPF
jgi:hypothetical protein